jgi:predicted glycoside hydrolase/deacetylase ChbG (UPF0249 family)
VVNADDFGRSEGVNRGVLLAHERGIVTSTSLMVRWPAAVEAAALGRDHPRLGLGLHVDLGEWECRGGTWEPVYEVVPVDDPAAVAAECRRQIERFGELVGRDPTHLDSHQNVHRGEPARSVLLDAAGALGVPVRFFGTGYRFFGGFYGQAADGTPLPGAIRAESLVAAIEAVGPGVTELSCHPGLGGDVPGPYHVERAAEVEALCDARAATAVTACGIELGTFAGAAAFLARGGNRRHGCHGTVTAGGMTT